MNHTKEKILNAIKFIEDIAYNQVYEKGHALVSKEGYPTKPETASVLKIDLVVTLTINIIEDIFGRNSEIFVITQSQLNDFKSSKGSSQISSAQALTLSLSKLEVIRAKIELGMLNSIYAEIASEIVSDFNLLSKKVLDEGRLSVSSVLACAALEDALKRFAIINDIEVTDKSMSEVVNSLKSKGLISNAQSNILKGFTVVRNKSFHAEWDKVTEIDIRSILAFTDQFIIDKLES